MLYYLTLTAGFPAGRNFSQIVQMRKIYEEYLSKIYAAKKKGK